MTRALVLSGGGVKGAYQVGVLRKWLHEDKTEYDIFSGVSVGALNCGVLAQTPYGNTSLAFDRLSSTWSEVSNCRVRRDHIFFGKLAALWFGAAYDSSPLQQFISERLNSEELQASGKKLLVGATCLDTGAYRVVRETDPDIRSWIYASAAFPLFFKEKVIQGSTWVDGGIRNLAPLGDVIRLGADEVDIILATNPYKSDPWVPYGQPIWAKAARVFEIILAEILLTDLQICGLKNDLAYLGQDYRRVKIRLVYPDSDLVSDNFDFDPTKIKQMMDTGYADARRLEISTNLK
jgi:NTE family protein